MIYEAAAPLFTRIEMREGEARVVGPTASERPPAPLPLDRPETVVAWPRTGTAVLGRPDRRRLVVYHPNRSVLADQDGVAARPASAGIDDNALARYRISSQRKAGDEGHGAGVAARRWCCPSGAVIRVIVKDDRDAFPPCVELLS